MNVSTPAPTGSPVLVQSISGESKHDKFLRLADARVSRSLEDHRLVSQLVARTYEHKPNEAELIIKTLIESVADVARVFNVPLAAKVGKVGKADLTVTIFEDAKTPAPVETSKIKISVAKALDLLKSGEIEAAQQILADLL